MTTLPHLQQNPGQFQAEADFCANYGLELQRAADYGWVVRLATADHNGQVFGCIEQLSGCVELLRLDGGFHWATFHCLHDALEILIHQPPVSTAPDDGLAIGLHAGSVMS